jgi:hypothetical protein
MLSQNTFVNISLSFDCISDLTSNVNPKTNRRVVNEKGNNHCYISTMKTINTKRKKKKNESI